MVEHNHIEQGAREDCLSCASIRPESQVHPHLVPPLPVAYVPTSFEPELGEDDEPETPAHVAAMQEGPHRIVNGRAVCDGGHDARCHWWPDAKVCDHEEFPCGHEYVFHNDCWIIQWLDAGDLADQCDDAAFDLRIDDGDDLRWPNGVIDYEWYGEGVTWSYVSVDPIPEGEPVPAALPEGRRDSDVPLWEGSLA